MTKIIMLVVGLLSVCSVSQADSNITSEISGLSETLCIPQIESAVTGYIITEFGKKYPDLENVKIRISGISLSPTHFDTVSHRQIINVELNFLSLKAGENIDTFSSMYRYGEELKYTVIEFNPNKSSCDSNTYKVSSKAFKQNK